MDTRSYRTRHEFKAKTNPKGKGFIVAMDAGYSSMKVFYETGYFCFPSFAKKLERDTLNISGEKDILYRDLDTGEVYMLGYTAQEMIGSTDTNDTDSELYSRKRYGNKKFRVLCNAAIGIASQYNNSRKELCIQTGLPASYVKGDSALLVKALCMPSNFALKVGSSKWQEYHLKLDPEKIDIIPQPMGSLYSTIIKNDGKYVPDARSMLMGNLLVMDIGFGTCDFYGFKSREIVCSESLDDVGMKGILKAFSGLILNEYGEDIRVQALQHVLEEGTIVCVDEDTLQTEIRPVGHLLKKANDQVFQEAMERAKNITNAYRDYQYLIVTGGTGEAWFGQIREYLSGMKTLKVLPGNMNDTLPFLYSNARGYYLYRYVMEGR